jgi:predicted nucleic acid-binding protein
MGIAVDTNVFTICERKRWTGIQIATHIADLYPNEGVVIPCIAAAEMIHGIYRATTPAERNRRESFVELLLSAYPVVPFTVTTARIAGRIRGEQAQLGNTLPLGDSLIAAMAIELDYAILTHNVKDFVESLVSVFCLSLFRKTLPYVSDGLSTLPTSTIVE